MSTSGPSSSRICCANKVDTPCGACAELAKLERSIRSARQTLVDMETQRLRLLSNVNLVHDPLSRTLPLEIFSNIFSQCLPGIGICSTSALATARHLKAPLLLSQVCRQWRMVAHSIPSLWTVMPLYIKKSRKPFLGDICDLVREWLGRSGHSLPIKIILRIESGVDELGWHALDLFATIQGYSHRLDYFQVKASQRILGQLRHSVAGDPTTLRLSGYTMKTDPVRSRPSKLLRPTMLYIRCTLLNDTNIDPEKLTHVDASGICHKDVIQLIKSAPRLITFKLNELDFYCSCKLNSIGTPHPPSLTTPYVHHALLGLIIISPLKDEWSDKSVPAFMFSSFNFPALKYLRYEDRGLFTTEKSLPALDAHISRSNSRLERLNIDKISQDIESNIVRLETLLQRLGADLVELEISVAYPDIPDIEDDGDESHDIACRLGDLAPHLPKLRTLRLSTVSFWWLAVLKELLLGWSEVTAKSEQRLTITLWNIGQCFTESGDIDPGMEYRPHSGIDERLPLLKVSEIREMIAILDRGLISVTLSTRAGLRHNKKHTAVSTKTRKLVAALRRLLAAREEVEKRELQERAAVRLFFSPDD